MSQSIGANVNDLTWPYKIGETVRRRDIHARFGGQWQSGIAPLSSIKDIVVFTDPASGAKLGYAEFEGQREDGTYSYTGAGQVGDQTFSRGNKALFGAAENGSPIRLFRAKGPNVTYVGEFITASKPYTIRRIPDRNGDERDGIIFSLLPVDAEMSLLPAYGEEHLQAPLESEWAPPSSDDVEIEPPIAADLPESRVMLRNELRLQADFGEWLQSKGHQLMRLQLPADGATIEPDLYVPAPLNWIVEAKRSPARSFVREAIGQVLDYVNVAELSGMEDPKPVILLPGAPARSMQKLIHELGITLVFRSETVVFEVLGPS